MNYELIAGVLQTMAAIAPPRVDALYDAEVVINRRPSGGNLLHRFYQTNGRIRCDLVGTNDDVVISHLLHADKKKIYVLHPRTKEYEVVACWSVAPRFEPQDQPQAEVIDGITMMHHNAIFRNIPPLDMAIHWWLTPEGIIRKLYLRINQRCDDIDGQHERYYQTGRIQLQKQSAALFDIPQDYRPKAGTTQTPGQFQVSDLTRHGPRRG